MCKLAFALLIVAATQPVVFGNTINNAAFDKPMRHPREWADLAVVVRFRRTPVRVVLPTSKRAVSKTGNKAHKTASKGATREDKTRLEPTALKGKTKRAPNSHATAMVTFLSGTSLPIVKGPDRAGQEHYDPNRSGNPLLNTSGANRLKMLSDNFSVNEIARSGNKIWGIARIDPRHVACLQEIRDYVGKPVSIRSGYRSFWYNIEIYRRMGKAPTKSQHISGRASDIKIEGMTGLEIAKAAIDACGPNVAIGLGLGYAHIDVRGHSSIWKYEGVTNQQIAEVERYRMVRRVALRGPARKQRRGSLSKRV